MSSLPQNKQQLIDLLGFDNQHFKSVLSRAHKSYTPYSIKKKSGGLRRIEPPHKELKQVQRALVDNLFSKLPSHPLIFPRKHHSLKDALVPHVLQPVVISLDIKDFFPRIKTRHIRHLFVCSGFNEEVSDLLVKLVTYKGHLPQGAPTSPIIARHYSAEFVKNVVSYLPVANRQVTVYADDILISGPKGLVVSIQGIKKIAGRYGFIIKRDKTKVMKTPSKQIALGVGLNPKLHMPKAFIQKAKFYRESGRQKTYRNMMSYKSFIES